MFQGIHGFNMDAKGRLAIPTKVREQLLAVCEGRVVVTAHPDERCLILYPESKWAELLPAINALPNMNKKAAKIKRLMMGNATAMELDGNGRILLSEPLRQHALMDKKLVMIGQGESFELWDAVHYDSYINREDEEELPEEIKQNFSF